MTGMKRTFEEEWPELAGDLKRFLARRGVTTWHAEDVIQETGLRLFKMWDEVDFLRSPRGLAYTIASNLLWDERNRKAGREVVGEIPEQPCDFDVERAGLARLELGRVRSALDHMSPQHQNVLLAEIDRNVAPEGTPAAIKMLRMRARRRLSAILETAPASAFAPLIAIKSRLWRSFSFVRRHSTFVEMPATALATMAGAMALLILPGEALPVERRGPVQLRSPLQASIQAEAEVAAVMGRAVTKIASAPARATRTARETRSSNQQPEGGDAYVTVGGEDQPAEAEAVVDLSSDEDPPETPGCEVEPEGNGASYDCQAEAGGQQVRASGHVELRP